ncbi:cell division protein FtsX [Amylibacter ulvae]|uniref:Cell division protein FtsX n=1 Tax=Paramylibacter ulvae TaxID=1651968 RepID=A0ABQ3D3B9_9RHOB|nr:FtsX-like permease family protein [Amylibacter ulvae]GHA56588.1 cell division protein FtsX [Amylibacter ulvae]
MSKISQYWQIAQDTLSGDQNADRVVPPSGYTASLTTFVSFAMAFLTVFALALFLATGRLADRWATELAGTSTVRISAPAGQMDAQAKTVLGILETTPGIASARLMSEDEQRRLLTPWFGVDLPMDNLPIPSLVEITEEGVGPDVNGLRLRLQAEAPGAILDDHTRWRRPMVKAAQRLRLLGGLSIGLIVGSTIAMITLAAQAALSANGQVISVLRLIGARDNYIAKAFVRRFTIRAFLGGLIGSLIAMLFIYFLPAVAEEGAFLTGLGFQGVQWLLPLFIPVIAAIIAFVSTRFAANSKLQRTA